MTVFMSYCSSRRLFTIHCLSLNNKWLLCWVCTTLWLHELLFSLSWHAERVLPLDDANERAFASYITSLLLCAAENKLIAQFAENLDDSWHIEFLCSTLCNFSPLQLERFIIGGNFQDFFFLPNCSWGLWHF